MAQPMLCAAIKYFYPRPPRGGRPSVPSTTTLTTNFYPRPPRGGRPDDITTPWTRKANFYPRPPRGGRPADAVRLIAAGLFLSTPSARRATRQMTDCIVVEEFLSTPSARRATCYLRITITNNNISIHALREEGDLLMAGLSTFWSRFLSTPSARRATRQRYRLPRFLRDFYPRPPRGGRRGKPVESVESVEFLSTPSARRATPRVYLFMLAGLDFYPRPPRGGRQQKQRQNLYFLINYTTFCTNLEEP